MKVSIQSPAKDLALTGTGVAGCYTTFDLYLPRVTAGSDLDTRVGVDTPAAGAILVKFENTTSKQNIRRSVMTVQVPLWQGLVGDCNQNSGYQQTNSGKYCQIQLTATMPADRALAGLAKPATTLISCSNDQTAYLALRAALSLVANTLLGSASCAAGSVPTLNLAAIDFDNPIVRGLSGVQPDSPTASYCAVAAS